MDVVLVNMPFGPLATPALGISILAAQLKAKGISVKIEYFNIKFADLLGEREYKYFCDGFPATHALFAEWVFSEILNSSDTTDVYLEKVLIPELIEGHSPAGFKPFTRQEVIELSSSVKSLLVPYLESCLHEILSLNPKVVGFTSTFQQHTSSLLLAKMLKKHLPEVIVVFGGANCDGKMGLETIQNYPFIDVIFQGESENTFPTFVESVLLGGPDYRLANIITSEDVAYTGDRSLKLDFVKLDEVPYPDFDDFITAWASMERDEESPLRPTLLFETARGCWWGQKNHCTFCGLNGDGMTFRSKCPERALDELKYLVERYDNKEVTVVDNILDMKYFKTFIPMLRDAQLGVDLFWEVKANLKYEHLKILKDAGITAIQPGIESFSDQVLQLMNKGVSAIQNLQFLKWCSELDIYAVWNLLYGFTYELPEEYGAQAILISKITHLQPPTGYFPIRLDRYSPNFDRSDDFGFFEVKPMQAYNYIYPNMTPNQIHNMAYFFTHKDSASERVSIYTDTFRKELRRWKAAANSSILIHIDDGCEIIIFDTRPKYSSTKIRRLTDVEAILYRLCNTIQTIRGIYESPDLIEVNENTINRSMENLLGWGYAVEINGKYLSLGLDVEKKVFSDAEILVLEELVEARNSASAI